MGSDHLVQLPDKILMQLRCFDWFVLIASKTSALWRQCMTADDKITAQISCCNIAVVLACKLIDNGTVHHIVVICSQLKKCNYVCCEGDAHFSM
jgi:hypothetical protein